MLYRIIREKDGKRFAWEKELKDGQYYWRNVSDNSQQKFSIENTETWLKDLTTIRKYQDQERRPFDGDIFIEPICSDGKLGVEL
jgi:hypothetical protein